MYLPSGNWTDKNTFCIAEYKSSKQFNMKIKESLCTYHSHTEMKKKHILQCKIQVIKTVQYERQLYLPQPYWNEKETHFTMQNTGHQNNSLWNYRKLAYLPTGYWNKKKTFCIAGYKSSKQFNVKIKESLCTYHSHTEMKNIY